MVKGGQIKLAPSLNKEILFSPLFFVERKNRCVTENTWKIRMEISHKPIFQTTIYFFKLFHTERHDCINVQTSQINLITNQIINVRFQLNELSMILNKFFKYISMVSKKS